MGRLIRHPDQLSFSFPARVQLALSILPRPNTCPRCHGTGHVYYRKADVPVTGGKRKPCPACQGDRA